MQQTENRSENHGESFLRVLGRACGNALLPPLCFCCRAPVERVGQLCADCWKKLNFISGAQCAQCGVPFDVVTGAADLQCEQCLRTPLTFSRARAPLLYDETSRALILAFKHYDQVHAAHSFLPWLQTAGAELLARADALVPVPLSRQRLFWRRYNQAAVLAQLLARSTGKAYWPQALLRTRNTATQGGQTRAERFKNVSNAFVANPKTAAQLTGKNILLLDDVLTTGATASACATALLAAGAARVDVLTVARVALGGHG